MKETCKRITAKPLSPKYRSGVSRACVTAVPIGSESNGMIFPSQGDVRRFETIATSEGFSVHMFLSECES